MVVNGWPRELERHSFQQLVLFLNKIKEGKDKATLSRRQGASYKKTFFFMPRDGKKKE